MESVNVVRRGKLFPVHLEGDFGIAAEVSFRLFEFPFGERGVEIAQRGWILHSRDYDRRSRSFLDQRTCLGVRFDPRVEAIICADYTSSVFD
jgi:hypothetical protein